MGGGAGAGRRYMGQGGVQEGVKGEGGGAGAEAGKASAGIEASGPWVQP